MPWIDVGEIFKRAPPSRKEVEQVLEYRKRKAKPKFYADENLPIAIVKRLLSMGVQVLTAHQVCLSGHPDENRTALALRHGYILLTCDRDYLDEGRFPLIHCPAIVVFDFGSGSLRKYREPSYVSTECSVYRNSLTSGPGTFGACALKMAAPQA
jgi:predicted nuclease of predicted toxin-antitoxin system